MDLGKDQIEVKDIDHLGLIAGIMDEMDLVRLIDDLIPPHVLEKVSVGLCIKAMILNCMGFLTSPIYLFSKFFEGKAVEHLLGEDIKAEYLNESRLGRALDEIFKYGLTQLFIKIAMSAMKVFNVPITSGHFDTTSISVEGEYNKKVVGNECAEEEEKYSEGEDLKEINITYGYSRDRRPDLKQFVMGLVTNGEAGVPCMISVADGNESDGKHLHKMMKEFINLWEGEKLDFIVMDSGGYTPDNLREDWGVMNWITRVPATIKEAKKLLQGMNAGEFVVNEEDNRYKSFSVNSSYGGVNQRWFIVQSELRRLSDLEKLDRDIRKEKEVKENEFARIYKKGFACESDALEAVKSFGSKLKFHEIAETEVVEKPFFSHRGRAKLGEQPEGYTYHPKVNIEVSESLISPYKNQAGRFILATNCLDEMMLSPTKALSLYKEQQGTERGFRFIKDPSFFASSVFLKSARRIMALAFIMALALLVYSLGQNKLRMALQKANEFVPNQKRKPTNRPTLRWIFQCFQSIHLIYINGVKSFIPITESHLFILRLLGTHCQKYYCLS